MYRIVSNSVPYPSLSLPLSPLSSLLHSDFIPHLLPPDHRSHVYELPHGLSRTESTAEFLPLGDDKSVEYFFASDASAIIEHTNRVLYLLVS